LLGIFYSNTRFDLINTRPGLRLVQKSTAAVEAPNVDMDSRRMPRSAISVSARRDLPMKLLAIAKRSQSLALLSLAEYGTPFLRMIALSRVLALRELGFASALTATSASFGLLGDFAAHRFVLSAPREEYEEALAGAHALTFLRGIVIGALALASAPFIAAAFSLPTYWGSFALVGTVFFIGSLENLAPRIDERNYRYGVQLNVALVSNGLGLMALLIILALTRSHYAIIASLFAQATGQVVGSHLLAATPYRMNFRSRYFWQAFRFGFPLMVNGLGLAASSQGDRFIVGSLLGLPALGLYSVATLVALVPMSIFFRFAGTFTFAALYNAAHRTDGSYAARLKIAARLVPLASAVYALGIVTLLNIVMPLVFGSHFTLSMSSVRLLAFVAFFRVARIEPFTALLLHVSQTRRIAVANLASSSALLFEVALIMLFGTFESVIAGKLAALAIVIYLTLGSFRPARRDFILALSVSGAILSIVVGLTYAIPVGTQLAPSALTLVACLALFAIWATHFAPPLLRAGFSRPQSFL
jgi:O-antigen/teichoic acid export membrane protein